MLSFPVVYLALVSFAIVMIVTFFCLPYLDRAIRWLESFDTDE